jgi:hypothetical protein
LRFAPEPLVSQDLTSPCPSIMQYLPLKHHTSGIGHFGWLCSGWIER